MTVLDQVPTKVGQRVQDAFVDTRGWVRELGERNGVPVAVVEWDDPATGLGDDDSVFPVDALRVVQVIQIDADLFEDPSNHPQVQYSYCGAGRETHYVLKGGAVMKGRDQMRLYMMGYHTTPSA